MTQKIDDALETFKQIMLYIEKRHDSVIVQLCKDENVSLIFEIMSSFGNR